MAYRRRQGITRASTFKEEIVHRSPDETSSASSSPLQSSNSFSASSSLAAQAIRASALSNERNRSKVGWLVSFRNISTLINFPCLQILVLNLLAIGIVWCVNN